MSEQQSKSQAEYVVLKDLDLGASWSFVSRVTAANGLAAIKAAEAGEGRFVAVPVRSWKPVTRKQETKTVDVWS